MIKKAKPLYMLYEMAGRAARDPKAAAIFQRALTPSTYKKMMRRFGNKSADSFAIIPREDGATARKFVPLEKQLGLVQPKELGTYGKGLHDKWYVHPNATIRNYMPFGALLSSRLEDAAAAKTPFRGVNKIGLDRFNAESSKSRMEADKLQRPIREALGLKQGEGPLGGINLATQPIPAPLIASGRKKGVNIVDELGDYADTHSPYYDAVFDYVYVPKKSHPGALPHETMHRTRMTSPEDLIRQKNEIAWKDMDSALKAKGYAMPTDPTTLEEGMTDYWTSRANPGYHMNPSRPLKAKHAIDVSDIDDPHVRTGIDQMQKNYQYNFRTGRHEIPRASLLQKYKWPIIGSSISLPLTAYLTNKAVEQ